MSRRSLSVAAACALFLIAGIREISLAAQAPSDHPRLLVLLVVDQMRADYVDEYGGRWTGGLKRLIDAGAVFSRTAYPYFNTVTCAGHATISTGTFPATHGIISNQWWDRGSGRLVTCTQDRDAALISYGAPASGGDSPAALRVSSLGDALSARFGPASRSVSVSVKDRSAIMLAGHRADAVTWLNEASDQWVTSRAYGEKRVEFVREYVRQHPFERELTEVWNRLAAPDRYLFQDDATGERPPNGWTQTFPHPLSGEGKLSRAARVSLWEASPFSDEYVADVAATAIDALKLGNGSATDLLTVSFSALDLVGHRFGPRSHEVQDVLARLDLTIGRLFDRLDQRVGQARYVVALTADHGVATIPEQLTAEGLDAGRIVAEDIGDRAEKALESRFGSGNYVARAFYSDVYFAPGVSAKVEGDDAARKAVIGAIRTVPGVERVVIGSDLRAKATDRDPLVQAVALSYFPGRSGDLIVIPRPNWSFILRGTPPALMNAATHGTANAYDSRVPLILMGTSIRAGTYTQAATPADVAPTLAFLAGATMLRTDGHVLKQALAESR